MCVRIYAKTPWEVPRCSTLQRNTIIVKFQNTGNSGRQVTGQSVNNQGNSYTQYSDGAYAYKNESGSSYYNTGSGHGFYTSPSQGTQASNGQSYSTHYNYNQGKNFFTPSFQLFFI